MYAYNKILERTPDRRFTIIGILSYMLFLYYCMNGNGSSRIIGILSYMLFLYYRMNVNGSFTIIGILFSGLFLYHCVKTPSSSRIIGSLFAGLFLNLCSLPLLRVLISARGFYRWRRGFVQHGIG